MNHPLLDPQGARHLLLGNEAIVRGALEAGVNVVTCYPGTPSSEVPDNFRRLLPFTDKRFVLEYSVNEKVALEVGAGAALAGALTLVTMKHVGVNVAADPLMTMTYTGLPGGLVLLAACDPASHSSQNEQDGRTYARFAGMPCFEPATAQECKDMTKAAFILARETQQPVMIRTTTRTNHLRGPVTYGPLPEPASIVPFVREMLRFMPVPAVARLRHPVLAANIEAIREQVETSSYNRVSGSGDVGVIASGISRTYLHDVLLSKGWQNKVTVFDFGMTWPLPLKALEKFMRSVKTVLVLEEGEPLVEDGLNALAHKLSIPVAITGKAGPLTIFGEYSTPRIHDALAPLVDKDAPLSPVAKPLALPLRPPNLCAGCSHRSAYYASRSIFGDDVIYSSDIGCYTLGMLPPLSSGDFFFCMGSSVSSGGGFARASDKPVVAFIGDSTFFHSGVTGLINAVFNKHDLLLVVLDNGTTAMTGHQPNPAFPQEALGDDAVHVDIETVVKGCGVSRVARVGGFNVKGIQKALAEMKDEKGVRVLIVEELCILFERRVLNKYRTQRAYVAQQDDSARACLTSLACTAFRFEDGVVSVDQETCAGCMACIQVSPSFKAQKGGA